MVKYILLVLSLLLLTSGITKSEIKKVPAQYSTIQAAIFACNNGDTVEVSPGTYFENINIRNKNIVVTSLFYLNNDLSYIKSTIINGSNPIHPDSASVVRIISCDSTTVLQGFTITGGKGTKWQDEHGAGRYTEGGGILIAFSPCTIRFNIITNNHAIDAPLGISSTGGGGIRMGDSNPKILNNIISDNSAMYGGGIVSNYTNAIVASNIIINNRVYQAVAGKPVYGGGGIWVNGSGQKIMIINNTVVNNSCSGVSGTGANRGGGILLYAARADIINTIVWGNKQSIGKQNWDLNFTNQLRIFYSNVQDTAIGTGNISINPGFADSNYLLSNSSQCIDKGDTSVFYNDPSDPLNPIMAKYPALGTIRSDIGAYGGKWSSVILNSIFVDVKKHGSVIPNDFELFQNYPNPFNPVTKIKFSISKTGYVNLKVFDSSGKEVSELINLKLTPGNYEYTFNSGNLPSGVYFYRLISGNFFDSKKMIVLK